jgi:hypothetical protein
MLWSIPKTGDDLPQSRPAAMILSQETGQAFTRNAIAATFEGEFSNVTASYAGKGVVRYAW